MCRSSVIVVTGALACGGCHDVAVGSGQSESESEQDPEPEFEPLCGQAAPLRILPLDPTEGPRAVSSLAFGERYLIKLHQQVPLGDPRRDVWSVGHCGEDPFLLAADIHSALQVYERYSDVVFGCSEDEGALLALDPTGVHPPHPTFALHRCYALENGGMQRTPEGLLTVLGTDSTGPLVLQRWPEDPFTEVAEQIVIHDEVKRASDRVLKVDDDEILTVTAAHELVSIALDDFEITIIATDVLEFRSDGRWIMWQDIEQTNADDPWSSAYAGPTFVLDRESGQITELGETTLEYINPGRLFFESHGLLQHTIPPHGGRRDRRLPSMELLSPSLDGFAILAIDEHRILNGSTDGSLQVYDLTRAEKRYLRGNWLDRSERLDDEGITYLDRRREFVGRITYDGDDRVLAPNAAAGFLVASDLRVVTFFSVEGEILERVGGLMIVDPDTHVENRFATDVLVFSISLHEPTAGQLIVSYLSVDPDPERYGVWIAKPAR